MQIGPKLRSKALKKLETGAKHVVSTNVRGLGRTEEKLNTVLRPIAAMIPGIGPVIMGAADASASVMAGHNLKHTAGQALKGATAGLIGKGVQAGLSHIPGLSSLASHIPGMGGASGGASSALGGGLNDVANAGISSVGGSALGGAAGAAGGSGILGSIGSFVGNHGTQLLEGAEGINAALQQKKANDLANRALGSAEGAYNDRAPLRQAGIAGMIQPNVPSIASLNQSGPNPYAQKPQAPGIVPAGY